VFNDKMHVYIKVNHAMSAEGRRDHSERRALLCCESSRSSLTRPPHLLSLSRHVIPHFRAWRMVSYDFQRRLCRRRLFCGSFRNCLFFYYFCLLPTHFPIDTKLAQSLYCSNISYFSHVEHNRSIPQLTGTSNTMNTVSNQSSEKTPIAPSSISPCTPMHILQVALFN
jgi:hypothetical protein